MGRGRGTLFLPAFSPPVPTYARSQLKLLTTMLAVFDLAVYGIDVFALVPRAVYDADPYGSGEYGADPE